MGAARMAADHCRDHEDGLIVGVWQTNQFAAGDAVDRERAEIRYDVRETCADRANPWQDARWDDGNDTDGDVVRCAIEEFHS